MPIEMNEKPNVARQKAKFMVSLGMLFAFVGIMLIWSAFGLYASQSNAGATATSLLAIGGTGHIMFGILLIMLSNLKIMLSKSRK